MRRRPAFAALIRGGEAQPADGPVGTTNLDERQWSDANLEQSAVDC